MLFVNTDGACEPSNPGGWGVGGWVIRDGDGELLSTGTVDLGRPEDMTNNIAEYAAVHGALSDLVQMGLTEDSVVVRTDSKLVVEQLNDRWRCNHAHLRDWRDRIWKLCEAFEKRVGFQWVPRANNKEADEVSRSLYPRD